MKKIFTLMCGGIIVFTMCTGLLNLLPLKNIVLFIVFQLVFLLIPGIALVEVVKIDMKTDIQYIGISYLMGYLLNIVVYFLTVPFGLKDYLVYVYLGIILVLSYVAIKKRKKRDLEKDIQGLHICGGAILVLSGIVFVTYSLCNMLPIKAQANTYWPDLMYWIGNSISLTKGFPPLDFRDYPQSYNYHYFSSMQIAVINLITKINVVEISFCYSYIQPIIMIVMGLYMVIKRFVTQKLLIILGMILAIFTTGFEYVALVTYAPHMYSEQFGFDYAVGASLFLLYFLHVLIVDGFSWKQFGIISVLFATLIGLKGPTGSILLVGIGILCIYWIIKKQVKQSFICGGITLTIFASVYFGITNTKGYGGESLSQTLSNMEGVHSHNTNILYDIVYMVYYMIISNPILFSLCIIAIIITVSKIKNIDVFDVMLIGMILCGIFITINTQFNGNSQMYFIMAIFPMAAILVVKKILVIWENREYTYKRIYLGLLIAGTLVGSVMMIYGLRIYINKGITNYIRNGIVITSENEPQYRNTIVDKSLYEVYIFMRDNLDEYDVIATTSKEQMCGIFTEKYTILYDIKTQDEKYLEELNVKYIITEQGKKEAIEESWGRIFYQNDKYVVLEKQ